MTTPTTFFTHLHTFSAGLESSIRTSLAATKSLKERRRSIPGSLASSLAPLTDSDAHAKQAEDQRATWTTLLENAARLKAQANQLMEAVMEGAVAEVASGSPRMTPTASYHIAIKNDLTAMHQQSAQLKRALQALEERQQEIAVKKLTKSLNTSSPSHSVKSPHVAEERGVKSPTGTMKKSSKSDSDNENDSSIGNQVVTKSSAPASHRSPIIAAAAKPKRKSLASGSASKKSSRASSGGVSTGVVSPSNVRVSRISPAKLAVALRRQSLEAKRAAESAAAVTEAMVQQLHDESQLNESKSMEDVIEEESVNDVTMNGTEVAASATAVDISMDFQSPKRAPSVSPKLSATPSSPSVMSHIPPFTPAASSTSTSQSRIPTLLDTPPTPELIIDGQISETTRRLLKSHSRPSLGPGHSRIPSAASVSTSSSTLSLIDSPATPELATVILAREQGARSARKASGIATPMMSTRKATTSAFTSAGRDALLARTTPSHAISSSMQPSMMMTPSRNLFAGGTPMSTRARPMSARATLITTPAAINLGSSTSSMSIPSGSEAIAFNLPASASSDDLDSSLNNSLLATPPSLSSPAPRFKAASVAWVSGSESAKKKPRKGTPMKSPAAASDALSPLAMPDTPPMTSPAAASSSSGTAVVASLPTQTPRSVKKGILKTPKSILRSSTVGKKSVTQVQQPSRSDPITPLPPAADSSSVASLVTPPTPATPILLSSLSASFGITVGTSPQVSTGPMNLSDAMAATTAPSSAVAAVKRRAASAK